MEQQNSNPDTTPQDQQQKCPYNLQTNSNFYPMPPGVYDRRTGRYMNEDQQIFHIMLDDRVLLDLIEDTPAALNKWSIKSPLESESIDAVFMLLKRAELPKEIQGKVNGIFETYKEINQTYQTLQTKYKEAAALLHDQPLQNKELIQIITLYYFATRDIAVVEPAPLKDDQRAELIATAQEMDQVYTNAPSVNQKYYLAPDYANIPQEFTEAREFFAYFPFISHYCCCKEFSDLPLDETADRIPEPQQLALPLLPFYKPDYYIMPNSLLMNDMTTNARIDIAGKAEAYDVYEMKKTSAYILISYEPDPESGVTLKGPEKLSAYQRMITNAVVSLFDAGRKQGQDKPVFSTEMLYRAMPGAGEKLSPQQKAAITKGLDKLLSIRVYMDATSLMQKAGVIGPREAWERDAYYLNLTRDTYKAQNGRKVHAYRINEEPPVYTYSRLVNRLCTIPMRYLDIKQVEKGVITDKPIRMSPEKQVIIDHVMRRIAVIKYDMQHRKPKQETAAQNKKQTRRKKEETQKQSHIILFSSIFEATGLTGLNYRQKKAYRDFVFDVLDYETAAGYIKGYKKQIKTGVEITGIEIIL